MHIKIHLCHNYSSYLSILSWEIERTRSCLSCRKNVNSSANQTRLARTRMRAWSVNGPCKGSNVSRSNSGVSEKSTSTSGTYEISVLIIRNKRTFFQTLTYRFTTLSHCNFPITAINFCIFIPFQIQTKLSKSLNPSKSHEYDLPST